VCFNGLLADVDLCRVCRDVYPAKFGRAEGLDFNFFFIFKRLKTPKIEQETCVSTGSEWIFHVFNPYSQAILRISLYLFAHIH